MSVTVSIYGMAKRGAKFELMLGRSSVCVCMCVTGAGFGRVQVEVEGATPMARTSAAGGTRRDGGDAEIGVHRRIAHTLALIENRSAQNRNPRHWQDAMDK